MVLFGHLVTSWYLIMEVDSTLLVYSQNMTL